MAFPRINMASFWCFFISCVIMVWSFFVEGSAAKSGWTNYPPLAGVADSGPTIHHVFNGGTLWLIGMVFNITASLLGSINFIATVVQLRAPGMTWGRLPFFVWAQFITAYLLLLAFPPLESAAIMNLFDRVFGSSFFMPTGLVVNAMGSDGQPLLFSGGGSPMLWQHLVLVPRASGGVRAHPAGHRHGHRDHRVQQPQAHLGLQVHGRRDFRARVPLASSSGRTTCT